MNDLFAGERLKHSPFHPRQKEFNLRNTWTSWNGYTFAEYYYDAHYEYFCIRNTCGTYDISPMQKYFICGADAEEMLNRMVTRDISGMKINRVTYLVWCNDEGRVIDDGTLFRLSESKYMLTCGSPNIAWLKMSAFGFDDIEITDVTDDIAALSLQGPTSCAILKRMGIRGIETVKPFGIIEHDFKGEILRVSRTGFTGDLGYELWIKPDLSLDLWDTLYAVGADYGIHPYGETATNMARLEAGFIMPAMEFNETLKTVHFEHDQTPFELNLGWLVDFNKDHFNGRSALLKEKQQGPKYSLAKLDIEGNKPAEGALLYSNKRCKRSIGYVTSAMWSPAVKANIALAMIKTECLGDEIWAEINYQKEIRHYSKTARCKVCSGPFWKPSRARATPPPDF
jgi:aminomethyltransferase